MTTAVFAYSLRKPTNEQTVSDQIWLAHQYFNDLIEIEHVRRQAVRAAQMSIGSIADEQGEIERLKQSITDLIAEKKQIRSKTKLAVDRAATNAEKKQLRTDAKVRISALIEQIKNQKEQQRIAVEALRIIKAEQKKALQPLYDAADAEAHVKHLATRKVYSRERGLYSGTYLFVEQSFDQARKADPHPKADWTKCPAWRKWSGKGAFGIWFKGGRSNIFEKNTLAWIEPLPEDAFDPNVSRGQRKRKQYTTLHIRVASDEKGKPIWTTFPMYMHRPLPEDAVIKNIKVIRTPWYQGPKHKWEVHLTLQTPEVRMKKNPTSMIAINCGWRKLEDNSLRVLTWVDNQGGQGELCLGDEFRSRIERSRNIRSIRDQRINVLKERLIEAGISCHKWRSPKRFHRLLRDGLSDLVNDWRPDTEQLLKAWAYRDNHLWWYERGCRNGALNYRLEQYRLFAKEIAEKYDIIVVERYALKQIVEDPDRAKEPAAQRVEGASSEARNAIRNAGHKAGCYIVNADSKHATQQCHLCEYNEPWTIPAAKQVMHRCEGCQEVWDQDVNNAQNLLDRAVAYIAKNGLPRRKTREARHHRTKKEPQPTV